MQSYRDFERRRARLFPFVLALYAGCAAPKDRPREAPAPPSAEPPREVRIPVSIEEARALWSTEKRAALPALEAFFARVDWQDGDVQESFELLRELAIAVEPGEPGDEHVLGAMRSLLDLAESRTVSLPGEQFRAPWHVILRLVFGLRPSTTLGPMFVEVAEREMERLQANPDPASRRLSENRARNAVYGIGYLRYLPGLKTVEEYARASAGRSRRFGLELLGNFGHPDSVPLALAVIKERLHPEEVIGAARALKQILGDGAEPELLELLSSESPDVARAAAGLLFEICSAEGLKAVLERASTSTDKHFVTLVRSRISWYAQGLDMSAEELEKLIREAPEKASEKLYPLAHRLELLGPEEPRLSREDLHAVLSTWEKEGTIYTKDWSWVRDRHVVDAAQLEDLPRFEAVRRAILKVYRTTCVNEAEIIQRMFGAIQRIRSTPGANKN